MKHLFFIPVICLVALASCKKVKTVQQFPLLESDSTTELTASQIIWVEQVAKQKADSMRIIDSLALVTGNVDTTSLFYKKNMVVAIVEVNDHLFKNVTCYVDANGKQLFDLALPFAANLNINPATGKAYVQYNGQWKAMLNNGTFKQVQSTGMKVGLSLLGNHDDAGFCNFKNLADATAFAQIVAFEVRKNNFAAVLSDDEYSNFVSGADPNSYSMVMSEIKRLLPDIYLCYYLYGGSTGTFNGKKMGEIADASFTPFYPQDAAFGSLNFPNSKCFSSCEHGGALPNLQYLKQNGGGGVMVYNVGGTSATTFYNTIASTMKGMTLQIPAGCLNPNQFDYINGN